jgi:very-short-patch-repair endonuclease
MTIRQQFPDYGGRRKQLRRDSTLPEALLWRHLRNRTTEGHKFRRQQQLGPYIVDFYCAAVKLVIEIDGRTAL